MPSSEPVPVAVRIAAALAAVVVVATACSGDSDGRQTVSDEPPVTNADLGGQRDGDDGEPHPVELEEEAVIAAHRAAMDARIDSAAAPTLDPDFPALEDTHTDPYLTEWRDLLVGLSVQGHAIRYPEGSELEVVEINDVTFSLWVDDEGSTDAGDLDREEVGDKATVKACLLDDGETFDTATGEVLEDGLYTIFEVAVMRKIEGDWKLAERTATSREGRQPCGEAAE